LVCNVPLIMAEDTPVSWIDAAEVADLVRQLQGPAQPPAPGAWELHTLPPEAKATGPAWSLMPDEEEQQEAEQEAPYEAVPVQTGFEPVVVDEPELPALDSEGMEQALDDGATSEIERIRHQLRMLRQRAEEAGVVAAPAPQQMDDAAPLEEVRVPVLELPDTGLGDRLHALCEWAQRATESDEVVLVGEFGDVIAGASTQISLLLSELMAWQSSLRDDPALALTSTTCTGRPMPDGRCFAFIPVRSSYGGVTLSLVLRGNVTDELAEQLAAGLVRALDPVA